jgi:hypothetical protein
MEIDATVANVEPGAFIDGFAREYDYVSAFSGMRGFAEFTAVATWDVRKAT